MLALLLLVPTVAVMPFRDLSGGSGHAGDAISETVTSDLRQVEGLRVVERGEIDRVIGEQNLQAKKNDLDAAGSIRVGTLLGATMIVAGAYQRVAASVRLTARFIDVATGEIKGSAKIDGDADDFLSLQDRMTARLLESAGIAQPRIAAVQKRSRPKLRGWRPIELYGDALTAPDDATKKQLLQQTLNEDPQFSYAARDLDALEKRLRHYDDAAARASAEKVNALYATVRHEKDPMKLYVAYVTLIGELSMQRRWRRVIELTRAMVASPPPFPDRNAEELARQSLISALAALARWDDVLREGELYAAKFPAARGFPAVRGQLARAIAAKRRISDGKTKAADEIAKHPKDDECQRANSYQRNDQLADARGQYEAGLAHGCKMPRNVILSSLLWLCVRTDDHACAEKYSAALEREPIVRDSDGRLRDEARRWPERIPRDD